VKLRMPTRLRFGEGRVGQGGNRHEPLARSAGVVGTARRNGDSGNWGRPAAGEGRVFDVAIGGGPQWESDRVAVLLKPGNAGGGKDPDFWRASDGGEDR
jgi:hypothetical protein